MPGKIQAAMKQQFHLIDSDRLGNLLQYVANLPLGEDWVVTVAKKKQSRTLAQNSTMHMWFAFIAEYVNEHYGRQLAPKWFKEYFKELFLGEESQTIKGKVVTIKRGTSDLTVKEGAEFMAQVEQYCAEEWGVILPHPDDYRLAMGR
jgi:hypothetical protein